jgi:hypothetical protein
MNHPTVIILSSDPAFSREITANWPRGSGSTGTPEFIVFDPILSSDLNGGHYDLAILDNSGEAVSRKSVNKRARQNHKNVAPKATADDRVQELKLSLVSTGRPAIVIQADSEMNFYAVNGAVIEIRREPQVWAGITGLIGREVLRRRQAESQSFEAERLSSTAQAEATLGRFMLEMRVSVNNALTTLLGNAELLSHEAGLPAAVHAQADTIRNMSLRLHEIFQRFSSLEKELRITAGESGQTGLAAAIGRR